MVWSVMLTFLVHFILASHGVECLEPGEWASLGSGVMDLPWRDELCCDSPAAHLTVEDDNTGTQKSNRSESQKHLCNFKSLRSQLQSHEPSGGRCLDMLCRIENCENVTCELQPQDQALTSLHPALIAVSLKPLLSKKDKNPASDNPVICESDDSFTCSFPLGAKASLITVVTVSMSDAVAPPIHLRIPARPVKLSPPVNLSHVQTIDPELILHWINPPELEDMPLNYEVRYLSNNTHPSWQVVSACGQPRLSLDLRPKLNYTVQVRCSSLHTPPLWSDWSKPHHIFLYKVSYLPKEVVARPGEDVTVYCVFNDQNINATMATWKLNNEPIHHSQYYAVNQRVTRVTVRPSETHMYDLLKCTKGGWNREYSQIYIEGASINISCETNGEIDTMDCRWSTTQLEKLTFRYRWADLPCDFMETAEKGNETVGTMGPPCLDDQTCRIKPLRTTCYKLWLELGPVKSKPVYLSPMDHVKPHVPTNVKAVTLGSGLLNVTWEPPYLPAEGVQCQFRYHSPSTVRVQLEWQVQTPANVRWAVVAVSDMCSVFAVEVRCKHTNGIGYWSDWSKTVYSTPLNSRAPERGPDFWRILQDDPNRNKTHVELLFENLEVSGRSYCVNGFIVQHQTLSGSVMEERIGLVSSYSFEWKQEVQTVTVAAYNKLGSSADNFNMTLERQPKSRCIHSFTVLSINGSCVSLTWSLLKNSSNPLFMVVQWTSQGQLDYGHHESPGGGSWARLAYTERSVYLRGDFFGSEDFSFTLFPIFADGEAEPVYTKVTRRDPAAFMLLLIISFLSIVLFVTLVLTQQQMKKFVWKDVPNPKKCSWAKGLELKKVNTFDQLFRPPDGLPVWPLLLPTENISKVVLVDKVDLSALTSALVQAPCVPVTPDLGTISMSHLSGIHSELAQLNNKSEMLLGRAPSFVLNIDDLTSSNVRLDTAVEPQGSTYYSSQPPVTYATVLLSNPSHDHLHFKDGSGNSSSDEGNFSANNSDISGSLHGGMWELDDPRRSCSYNSAEDLSETSEQEEGEEARDEKDLYYLGMDYQGEDEESEEDDGQGEEEMKIELLKSGALNRVDCLRESHPLLEIEDSKEQSELPPAPCFSPMYLPQFRTALNMRKNQTCESHTNGF